AWALIGLAGSVVFAAGTVALVSLIEPIFSEVLESKQLQSGMGMIKEHNPLGKHGDLTNHLGSAYRSLKRRSGIRPDDVVWFVPTLFVIIALLRSLASFLNGYAFQRIGLGATTDLRNELYRRILEQSSRFYAQHPSG